MSLSHFWASIKKNYQKYRNKKLFVRLLLVLIICISAATILSGGFLYYNFASSMREEVGKASLGQLRQAGTVMDLVMQEVNRAAGQFVADTKISEYSIYANQSNTYELNGIANRMAIINHANKLIHSIYIYFENNQRIVTTTNSEIYHADSFYDLGWMEYYKDLGNVQTLPTRRFERRVGDRLLNADVITHLRSVPLYGDKKGAVIVNVDTEQLTQLITKSLVTRSAMFAVSDSKGNILLSTDTTMLYKNITAYQSLDRTLQDGEGYYSETVNGKKMLIAYTYSQGSDFKFFYLIPEEVVFNSVRSTQLKIILVCSMIILLGVVISIVVSTSVYRPINKLLENLLSSNTADKLPKTKDEVKLLSGMFGELMGEKVGLEKQMTGWLPVLREKFLRVLLTSDIMDKEEFQEKLRMFQLSLTGRYFQVITFEIGRNDRNKGIKTAEGLSLVNSYIKELVEMEFTANEQMAAVTEEIDMHTVGVLLNYDQVLAEESTMNLMEQCKRVNEKLWEYLNIRLFAAIGKPVEHVKEIHFSFASCQAGLRYKAIADSSRVIYINDIEPGTFGNLDLMYDKEELLTRYVAAQDKGNCEMITGRIVNTLKTQKMEPDMVRGIFYRFAGAIQKTGEQNGIPVARLMESSRFHQRLGELETVDEWASCFLELCNQVIDEINSRKPGKYVETIDKVKRFIDGNFSRDIGTDDAALAVDMSNSHFSKVFKEETGSTFVEYLTRYRMEKAKELLEKTELKISEISAKVGYNNQSYFIAQFKSYSGLTPKGYKDMKQWRMGS